MNSSQSAFRTSKIPPDHSTLQTPETQNLRAKNLSIRYHFSVNTARNISNLALVGFMGSGKSTVGRLVAKRLQFQLIDTDEEVERLTGKKITDIFESEGEAQFRTYESQIIQSLATQTHLVISTGGGAIIRPENLKSLKTHALVVCLWTRAETIWQRVRTQSHRPLLQTSNPLETIRSMLQQRDPFYRQADVLINTEVRSLSEVTSHVMHQFKAAYNPKPSQNNNPIG